jgi:hypothetical protein
MSENNISATELNNNLKNRLIIDVRESKTMARFYVGKS